MLKTLFCAAIAALVSATLLSSPASADVVKYNVQDLGTLGGVASHAWAVNDSGVVVGQAQNKNGEWHACMWDSQGIHDLGLMGESNSCATAISNSGVVVGYATSATGVKSAFVWTDANGIKPILPQQYSSLAMSINSSGQVAGYGQQTSASSKTGSVVAGANVYNYTQGVVTGVNNSGWCSGQSSGGVACVWVNGTMTELPSNTYLARGINNDGWVAGATWNYSGTGTGGNQLDHGFVWDANNGLRVIGTSLSLESTALAINDKGQVVGDEEEGSGSYPCHGIVWDPNSGTTQRLDTLLDPNSSSWHTSDAVGINSIGQIVGDGYTGGTGSFDSLRALLITPDGVGPEPCVLVLASAGFAWLAGRRPRARRATTAQLAAFSAPGSARPPMTSRPG